MVNGLLKVGKAPHYESYESLKKQLQAGVNHTYSQINLLDHTISQAGTGADVEIEDKGTETIADIGKVAETWVAQISAYAEDVVVTLTWTDTSGDSSTSTVTLTDANETAFTTPISTGYMATACEIDVVNPGGVTVKVGVTGMGTPVATVAAGATKSTEALLSGTGRVYAATMADDATQHGKDVYMDFVTPWNTLKYGFATLGAANSTTVASFYEATKSAAGVYTATDVLVKDFYRRRELSSEAIAVATKEIGIVNAGSTAIYGIIPTAARSSLHSRYMGITGRDSWIANIEVSQTVITSVVTNLIITYTPYGDTIERTRPMRIANNATTKLPKPIRLAEATEAKFTILGNLAEITAHIDILEAVQK